MYEFNLNICLRLIQTHTQITAILIHILTAKLHKNMKNKFTLFIHSDHCNVQKKKLLLMLYKNHWPVNEFTTWNTISMSLKKILINTNSASPAFSPVLKGLTEWVHLWALLYENKSTFPTKEKIYIHCKISELG